MKLKLFISFYFSIIVENFNNSVSIDYCMRPDIVHKALGNEIRQKILLSIANKDKYLSEIANEINLAPQTADFHLNILAEIGLIDFNWQEGKKYYHLKDKKILEFLRERKPIPAKFHPKPPHEVVLEELENINKRLDVIEKKLDELKK